MKQEEFGNWVYEKIGKKDTYDHHLWIHWRDKKWALELWDIMKVGKREFVNDELVVEVPVYGKITFHVHRPKIGKCC